MKPDDAWEPGETAGAPQDFLSGGTRMADRIRRHDWSATNLGPIAGWPQSLKTVVQVSLSTRQPICFWWGRDLITFYNDAYEPMLGARQDRALGRPFREVWPDVWDDVLPFVREALAGRGTWMENLPLTMTRNGYPEQTTFTFSYSPLRDDEGRIAGILNIVTETTKAVADRAALEAANAALVERAVEAMRHIDEQRRSQEQLQLLQRELAHRMKNTLSVVQAIVSQTMRHSSSIPQANDVIAGRLAALSRAQDLLTDTNWASADIADVVESALRPHLDHHRRIVAAGPSAEVSAQQALGLSLAIHELATNAAKYGALSNEHGRVAIAWTIGSEDAFHFEWRESDGPPVATPTRKGFGSRLTERIVAGYFSGTAVVAYEPSGIVFRLSGRMNPPG